MEAEAKRQLNPNVLSEIQQLVEDFDMIDSSKSICDEESDDANMDVDDYTSGFISRYRKRKSVKKRINHGASGSFKLGNINAQI